MKKPVKVAYLSEFSEIAILEKSETDSDGDSYWSCTLEMIGYENMVIEKFPNKKFMKYISELQDLACKMGNFLRKPVITPIGVISVSQTQEYCPSSDQDEMTTAVEKIYKTLKLNFVDTHEYRIVNSDDFRAYVDLAYYHRLQSTLVEQGYTWAGDIEDMTVAE
ncbi:hypothetical protein GlitD10_0272, partial [Gloeomargarita lithophora Alchichica-D10]